MIHSNNNSNKLLFVQDSTSSNTTCINVDLSCVDNNEMNKCNSLYVLKR